MSTQQWIHMARQCLTLIDDLESSASPNVSTIPVSELVSIGQRLWWIIKRADRILDKIKGRLRTEAGVDPGPKRFDAPDGSHCIVTVLPPAVALRKEADMAAVKAALGPEFTEVFEEVVSYVPRRDFKVRVGELDPVKAQVVMAAVQLVDRTSRVGFKD